MTRWLRTRGIVAALVAAAGLSACVQALPIPGAGSVSDRERQQAQEALARWSAAVEAAGGNQDFMPVGELTGQVGDWEVEVGNNNCRAIGANRTATAALARPLGDRTVLEVTQGLPVSVVVTP